MSFIEQVATLNECGTIVNNVNGCTYDTFMTEMLDIERTINEAVNTFNRLVNTDAISTLLEDGGNLPSKIYDNAQEHKKTLLDKLKAAWARIVELFFKMLDTVSNWIYEQVVLESDFVDKHKDDIMRTTIIYGKDTYDVLDENKKKIYSKTVSVSESYLKSYKNILKPDFIEPIMDKSELNKYMNDNGKVDTKKLYDYYKDEILGHVTDIDIDDINDGKGKLIDGIKDRFKDVKTRKNKIISIRKKYQTPSNNLTPEEVKEFQSLSMAQIESLKAYNRVTLDYCKAATSILKKFIKNAEKEEK